MNRNDALRHIKRVMDDAMADLSTDDKAEIFEDLRDHIDMLEAENFDAMDAEPDEEEF